MAGFCVLPETGVGFFDISHGFFRGFSSLFSPLKILFCETSIPSW
jgi:hypothetical protein